MNLINMAEMECNIDNRKNELADEKLFEKYEAKKKRGELLDINNLTREEMVQIWFNEEHIAAEIAWLFNVSKGKVASIKSRFGITERVCMFELMCSVYPEFKECEFLIRS